MKTNLTADDVDRVIHNVAYTHNMPAHVVRRFVECYPLETQTHVRAIESYGPDRYFMECFVAGKMKQAREGRSWEEFYPLFPGLSASHVRGRIRSCEGLNTRVLRERGAGAVLREHYGLGTVAELCAAAREHAADRGLKLHHVPLVEGAEA